MYHGWIFGRLKVLSVAWFNHIGNGMLIRCYIQWKLSRVSLIGQSISDASACNILVGNLDILTPTLNLWSFTSSALILGLIYEHESIGNQSSTNNMVKYTYLEHSRDFDYKK